MRWRSGLGLVLIASLSLAAIPGVARGEEGVVGPEAGFFKAYYIQHAEKRPHQALLLYLEFLQQAPESPYAMNAARFAFALLQGEENAENRAAFLQAYGDLIPTEAPAPAAFEAPEVREAEAAAVMSRDVTLLEQYEDAIAAGRTIPDVTWASTIRNHMARQWKDGEFMKATRTASQVHRILSLQRIAAMLQRKQAETDDMRRQVDIDVSLGDASPNPDTLTQIEDNERALAAARTETGIAEQIARLYPDAFTSPGKYGLLPLTMGLALPDDPRFTAWLRRQKLWLADQSRRATSPEAEIRQAIDLGKILTTIDGLLHDGEWTKASAVARELWIEYSRRD